MIGEKIISWYIRNIIAPKIWVLDNPGFVITKFGKQSQEVFRREVFLPEELFVDFEKSIVNKYKEEGEQVLYSIGKNFGFVFSSSSNFPNIKNVTKKDVTKFAELFAMFLSTTWAEEVKSKVEWDKNLLHLYMKNFVSCSKNGIGLILAEGSGAGIWSYELSNSSIEAKQVKCQGRGDKNCEVICAPSKVLSKMKINFFKDSKIFKLFEDKSTYESINKIRVTKYAKSSIKSLIDSGFLSWERRIIRFKNQRFFPADVSLMYILESELKKLKGGDNILFNAAFEYGKKLSQQENIEKFVTDFMSALGWGDILVLKEGEKYKIVVNYFPWTGLAEKIGFALFRGMISGMLSVERKVILRKIKKDTSQGYFSLWLSE